MGDWTRRERKGSAKVPQRRHRTTIRWTGKEIRELARLKPPGIRLAEFIRQAALGSSLDRVDERCGDHRHVAD